jgi:hypothetical protein
VQEEENKDNNPASKAKSTLAQNYSPVTKHYVFNHTGNIMITTTGEPLDQNFKEVCAEVGVFFATMTKAIHSVTNPKTGKPYTIYNHAALKKVIESSGLFVSLHQQKVVFDSENTGIEFGKEFIESVLGISLSQEDLPVASEAFNAIKHESTNLAEAQQQRRTEKQEEFSARGIEAESLQSGKPDEDDENDRVSHIVFVCESLMGMPMVSVIVAHFESHPDDEEEEDKKANPTKKTKKNFWSRLSPKHLVDELEGKDEKAPEPEKQEVTYQKDTYLFVSPQFFKDHVNNLNVTESPELKQLIRQIKIHLGGLRK